MRLHVMTWIAFGLLTSDVRIKELVETLCDADPAGFEEV